jgi:hypothetical protein
MTSPDGITWTSRTAAADNDWYSVVYGNGQFVSVSYDGSGNRVMTSADGMTWTSRTSAADHQWRSVTYANGGFVAVADSGTGTRVMTSMLPASPVPTLGEWAMIFLASWMAMLGIRRMRSSEAVSVSGNELVSQATNKVQR